MNESPSKLPISSNNTKFHPNPVRSRKNLLPCVANRPIPILKLDIHSFYQGSIEADLFDRSAFVPTQPHKFASHKTDSIEIKSQNIGKSLELSPQFGLQSTSKFILKRLLNPKGKPKVKRFYTEVINENQANQKDCVQDRRNTFINEKISKSLSELKQNLNSREICQNWPEIVVKGITQDCRQYKQKHKKRATESGDNDYHGVCLSKISDYRSFKASEQYKSKKLKQLDKMLQARDKKKLKTGIKQRRRRCIVKIVTVTQ